MIQLFEFILNFLLDEFKIQLLDFFSVWGIVIQTVITIFISGITIWLMVKYGENQKMIKELKDHTKLLTQQYEILYEINKPFITIEDYSGNDSNAFRIHEYCSMTNYGLKLKNLTIESDSQGKISFVSPDFKGSIGRNEIVPIRLKFDDLMNTKQNPSISLSYFDEKGTKYFQKITQYNQRSIKISSPVEYKLINHETTQTHPHPKRQTKLHPFQRQT